MKKFIVKHWIVLVSLLVAFAVTFFYIPFILTNSPGQVNPCPNDSGTFGGLCNLTSPPVSLLSYLQDRETISSINWAIPPISFIIIFAFFYGEIKLIIYIANFQNKK